MNTPEITKILEQYTTEEICDAYLIPISDRTWMEDYDNWMEMPKEYLIAELFRRVIELEKKVN